MAQNAECKIKNVSNFFILLILSSAVCNPLFADSIYEKNVKEYLEKTKSGIMDPSDLSSNTLMEGMLALRRGMTPEEMGYFLKSISNENSSEINIYLMATLDVLGVFAEVGQIDGGNALASRFKKQKCDFAKYATLSKTVIDMACQ